MHLHPEVRGRVEAKSQAYFNFLEAGRRSTQPSKTRGQRAPTSTIVPRSDITPGGVLSSQGVCYDPRGCVMIPGGVLSSQGVCYHPRGCAIISGGVLQSQGVWYHPRVCGIISGGASLSQGVRYHPRGCYHPRWCYHPRGYVLIPGGGVIISGCVVSSQGVWHHPRGCAIIPGGMLSSQRVSYAAKGFNIARKQAYTPPTDHRSPLQFMICIFQGR